MKDKLNKASSSKDLKEILNQFDKLVREQEENRVSPRESQSGQAATPSLEELLKEEIKRRLRKQGARPSL